MIDQTQQLKLLLILLRGIYNSGKESNRCSAEKLLDVIKLIERTIKSNKD